MTDVSALCQNAKGECTPACPGVMQTIELTAKKEPINFGSDCEMPEWNIDSGSVILTPDSGPTKTFTVAKPFSFRAVYWQAENGTATVSAVFCVNGTEWQGAAGCR